MLRLDSSTDAHTTSRGHHNHPGSYVEPTQPASVVDPGDRELMTFCWILLAIAYVGCWVYFGLATFRKGHYWLFWIGFFLPFLSIIGALISPTPPAAGTV